MGLYEFDLDDAAKEVLGVLCLLGPASVGNLLGSCDLKHHEIEDALAHLAENGLATRQGEIWRTTHWGDEHYDWIRHQT